MLTITTALLIDYLETVYIMEITGGGLDLFRTGKA